MLRLLRFGPPSEIRLSIPPRSHVINLLNERCGRRETRGPVDADSLRRAGRDRKLEFAPSRAESAMLHPRCRATRIRERPRRSDGSFATVFEARKCGNSESNAELPRGSCRQPCIRRASSCVLSGSRHPRANVNGISRENFRSPPHARFPCSFPPPSPCWRRM